MNNTPKSLRLHIGLFGRRNVGKSSLLNAVTRQEVSIVSEIAGTTTDPVEKPMELLPLGPVVFIDTAGVDDIGALGEERVRKTRSVFDRTDLAVLVTDGAWTEYEDEILSQLEQRRTPVLAVFNKSDLGQVDSALVESLERRKIRCIRTCAAASAEDQRMATGNAVRQALLDIAPGDFLNTSAILSDLVGPGELAVLVVPIDKEAPKGRIILPQVQCIRDLLDAGAYCVVVRDSELPEALARLNRRPKLVVTDSQAFAKVAAETPEEIPMTGFSVLFSRFKGDLVTQVLGTLAIDELVPGDRVLIAEACSHHPIGDDIGRVKIPRWLAERAGGPLEFTYVQGHDFPNDLAGYKLVIQCGSCMQNRREVLGRILKCGQMGVPITNYGLAIAYSLGIFERALGPFPEALAAYRKEVAAI